MDTLKMQDGETPTSPDHAQGELEQLLEILRLARQAGWTVVIAAEDEHSLPSGNVLMVLPGKTGLALQILRKYFHEQP